MLTHFHTIHSLAPGAYRNAYKYALLVEVDAVRHEDDEREANGGRDQREQDDRQ